ncbi:MAG: hypothetical protein AVDCRST_MAG60-1667, partial [uncultured Nocardioides sp.]
EPTGRARDPSRHRAVPRRTDPGPRKCRDRGRRRHPAHHHSSGQRRVPVRAHVPGTVVRRHPQAARRRPAGHL